MQSNLLDQMIDAAWSADIPGGSKAESWFLPSDGSERDQSNLREVMRRMLIAAMQAGAKPVFWYRPRSDGGYDGPIPDDRMEEVRKHSGAWVPLYPWQVQQAVAMEPEPGQQWKTGNEFLPYHPSASHVSPEYRDGWNAAYMAAQAATCKR